MNLIFYILLAIICLGKFAVSQEILLHVDSKLLSEASSDSATSRAEAADKLALVPYQNPFLDILWNLLEDKDLTVKAHAALAIRSISIDAKIPISEAQKIAEFLRSHITFDKIDSAGNRSSNEDECWLLACRMLAVDSLYEWYPLISIVDYNIWQIDQMKLMFQNLASRRDSISNKTDDVMLALFDAIYNPSCARGMTNFILNNLAEDIDEISSERFERTLIACWKHRLIGKDRAMHIVLVDAMRPHLEIFFNKMMAIKDKNRRYEVERILNELSSVLVDK